MKLKYIRCFPRIIKIEDLPDGGEKYTYAPHGEWYQDGRFLRNATLEEAEAYEFYRKAFLSVLVFL